MAQQVILASAQFRAEREQTWLELERLCDRAERRGLRALDADELARLPLLYRATLSSLSVARAISLDRNLLEYLESLAGRAYFVVYGNRRRLGSTVVHFFARDFPRAVRSARWAVLLAALTLVFGILVGFAVTLDDQERFFSFVSESYAQDRGPASSTEDLRDVLYDDGDAGTALATFASFLFTHNAKIGILAFALGVAFGVPVFLLLFVNGLTLGAFGALYAGRGLSVDFWGWVMPHGVTELLAVVLCGAAGLVLGGALVFPGRHARLHNLAERGKIAGTIALGAVALFFAAGMIEGFFRQTVHSVPIRYAVVAATAVLWTAYFWRAGRATGAREDGS